MEKSLCLGYGCIYEDGEIKDTKDFEDTWLTWDEGWLWTL